MQPTRRRIASVQNLANTGSRKHAVVRLTTLPPACCSRGQVKSYFANSPSENSNPDAQLSNGLKPLKVQCHRSSADAFDRAACGRGLCRYDTIEGNGSMAPSTGRDAACAVRARRRRAVPRRRRIRIIGYIPNVRAFFCVRNGCGCCGGRRSGSPCAGSSSSC